MCSNDKPIQLQLAGAEATKMSIGILCPTACFDRSEALIINGGSIGLAKSAITATKLQLDIFNFIAVIRWGLAA